VANVYKNELVDLTTTDNTTIYTTPASSRAIIKSIIVSEDAGSGSTITFTITNAAAAVFNLFKDKAIASKATTELLTHPLILEENEVLKAQETGQEYNSDKEADDDVDNPETPTKREHISRSVKLTVESLPLGSDSNL
jgi:hypothetical protein